MSGAVPWTADRYLRAAGDLERLARQVRHDARPHWLAEAMEFERVARVHRQRAAELTTRQPATVTEP